MKRYIIDRFEKNIAICENENKTLLHFSKDQLPTHAKEGDIIIQKEDGTFVIDINETQSKKDKIRKKIDQLFE